MKEQCLTFGICNWRKSLKTFYIDFQRGFSNLKSQFDEILAPINYDSNSFEPKIQGHMQKLRQNEQNYVRELRRA